MGIPMPLVTGGGVTTYYTGPETANALFANTITWTIPYYDWITNVVSYRSVIGSVIKDDTLHASIFTDDLINIWNGVKEDWRRYRLTDSTLDAFTFQGEGITGYSAPGVVEVSVQILNFPPGISAYFPQSNYAKFGFFSWGVAEQGKVEWLNFANQTFVASLNSGEFETGFTLYLLPGLLAQITCRYLLNIPRIQYTVDGNTYSYPTDNDGVYPSVPPIQIQLPSPPLPV